MELNTINQSISQIGEFDVWHLYEGEVKWMQSLNLVNDNMEHHFLPRHNG